jgi:uncharacterized protein (DUF58 family)
MQRLLFLTCIMLIFPLLVSAQDNVSFTVEVSSDSVLMGNRIRVVFTVEGQSDDFQAPYFKEFDLISGPNVSSSFSVINGSASQKTSYTYYLKPREVGSYYIEPASVAVGGEILETTPIPIMVVPNPEGIIQEPERQQASPFDFDMFNMDEFGWPDFPSFDFDDFDVKPYSPPKEKKPKRKTYKL